MELKTRNVNTAFNTLVRGIQSGDIPTRKEETRNGPVLQIDEPAMITYEKPAERVLFNSERDVNPFFSVFESLWMLAGRNDVDSVAYYAANMKNYSDDGKTLNGAYGYRWRHAWGPVDQTYDDSYGWCIDQLDCIVDHLTRLPNSRRAVLQMWETESDLLKIDTSKDICCLAGDTKFRSPEGDTSIESLAQRFQTENGFKFPVYSVDTQTGDQRICWMTNAWKVGVKKTLKITLDDGSILKLTGDHKVFRKKKVFEGKRCTGMSVEEIQACDLVVGDRLLSELSKDALKRTNTAGYRQFKRNLFRNTSFNNMVLEHREYVSMFENLIPYKKGHSIHHKDGNKANNKIENLVQITNYEHFSHDKFGENNPHNKMSQEQKIARGKKHAVSIKKRWASMSPELRSALITRKANRTPEQWELVAEHNSSKSNHKIVKIEDGGHRVVYDFTVPGRHNAVLDNGVVVHNCNLSVMFSIRTATDITDRNYGIRSLDMTVTNRSNDLVWGMLGANYVHFSFLQEYMASRLGVEVGRYTQFSNNLHVYTENNSGFHPEKWLASGTQEELYSASNPLNLVYVPLVRDPVMFDREVKEFVEWHFDPQSRYTSDCKRFENWVEPFFKLVAQPMMTAFHRHKAREYKAALDCCSQIHATDWRIAASNWVQKRKENYENKSDQKG